MFEAEKDKYLMKHGFGATRLKAVLFDMDGVLFDSMPNHAYSWSHAMTQFGLHITPEEAYMHEGRTGGGTIDLLAQRDWGRRATEEEKQTIYKAKSDVFSRCPEAPRMPGAYELLKKVKADGFTPMVVTGSGQVYLMGLQKAGIQPWEGLVVENAPLGVQAGVSAGIFTIAVNTGPLPDKVLIDAGADLLFPSMQSLCEHWEEIRKTFA